MRAIFLAILLFICGFTCGCGETTAQKRNRALSQVNVLAEKISKEVGEDGWFVRSKEAGKDPWENDLRVTYERRGYYEVMKVTSNGPDQLPLTRDDIVASYTLNNEEYLKAYKEARQAGREKNIEGNSAALTKGLTKGVLDAWKNRGK